jgi:hypothetical protein
LLFQINPQENDIRVPAEQQIVSLAEKNFPTLAWKLISIFTNHDSKTVLRQVAVAALSHLIGKDTHWNSISGTKQTEIYSSISSLLDDENLVVVGLAKKIAVVIITDDIKMKDSTSKLNEILSLLSNTNHLRRLEIVYELCCEFKVHLTLF